MLTVARNLTCIFLGIIACVFFNLGMDYLNFDHGLHPAIAFPITILAIVAMWYFLSWDTNDKQDHIEYIDTTNVTRK